MTAYTCTSGLHFSQRKEREKRVATEYGKWINRMEWDFFCTFTTRYRLTVKSARRAMERLFKLLQKRYGSLRMFWVAEPFDSSESFHTHALIYVDSSKSQSSKIAVKNVWQVVSGGKNKKEYQQTILKRYQKNLGAHFYIGKYLTRNNADYDFLFSTL